MTAIIHVQGVFEVFGCTPVSVVAKTWLKQCLCEWQECLVCMMSHTADCSYERVLNLLRPASGHIEYLEILRFNRKVLRTHDISFQKVY